MRGIHQDFIDDLKTGSLSWFLQRINTLDDLALEIRQDYINIYYKGGNALRIRQNKRGYRFEFDSKYCLDDDIRKRVNDFSRLEDYRDNFELLLSEMDCWFCKHPKKERKIQHELIKLNTADFCVLDIEYAGSYDLQGKRKSFRIDMVAIHNGKIVIIENKNGESAMGGKAGIVQHYNDICAIIDSPAAKNELVQSMRNIAANKNALGLPFAAVTSDEIEILFIIFNPNERSKMLDNQLAAIKKSHPAKVLYITNAQKIDYNNAKILI